MANQQELFIESILEAQGMEMEKDLFTDLTVTVYEEKRTLLSRGNNWQSEEILSENDEISCLEDLEVYVRLFKLKKFVNMHNRPLLSLKKQSESKQNEYSFNSLEFSRELTKDEIEALKSRFFSDYVELDHYIL